MHLVELLKALTSEVIVANNQFQQQQSAESVKAHYLI